MAVAAALTLREGDRSRLEALVRSASTRPNLAQRARIVLMSAEGLSNTEIARRTGSARPTVISWRNRYTTGGIDALGDLPRTGRPAVVDELAVVATTLADDGHPPAHLGVSHWSSRLLGQQLSISFTTVARIWRKWGIDPHHVETFTFRTDLTRQAHDGALADGWRDRPDSADRTAAGGNAVEHSDRQTTSHTNDEQDQRSSRSEETGPPRHLDRSTGRGRDVKAVRAEFHGARGRRSGPTSRPGT